MHETRRKGGWYGWKPSSSSISQLERFELVSLLKLDKRPPAEEFEATASELTVPPPSNINA